MVFVFVSHDPEYIRTKNLSLFTNGFYQSFITREWKLLIRIRFG
jgi:hypothetical protein